MNRSKAWVLIMALVFTSAAIAREYSAAVGRYIEPDPMVRSIR
ncbi:hypothetical protein [Ramlibacter albus]|nr:hypothetical protein [Ramlibacter albus]